MIVLLTNASKTLKVLACLQSAAAKALSSSASEGDDQPVGNTRGTNSVIDNDNDEEITGKMTQSDKHEQPAETISQPASEEPPPKKRRGRPPNPTSLQKLPAEVYVEVEVEAEAGLQEHTRLHDHAVTTSLHLICLFSIYPVCAQHCHGSYTLFLFFVSVKEHPSHVCVKE